MRRKFQWGFEIMSDMNADTRRRDGCDRERKPAPAEAAERDAFAVIEALNAENSQLKDRVLRTLAEMENLRRRTEREVADAKTYGVTSFARDMLTVVDNLARALEHLPAEARAAADPQIQSVIEGVELTARDLEAALGRHGVKKLDPKGQKFDPNFHQAIFEVPDETLPAGTVSQVVQSGWTIGDRVLRPAMVGVSKGGPKAAPKERERRPPAIRPASLRRAVRRCHPPQGQVDPSALRQQGRGAGDDAVDAVEGEPRRPAEYDRVAGLEPERPGRIASLRAAEAEQRRIAERQRHDRRGKLLFVAVLVQAHLRRRRRRR